MIVFSERIMLLAKYKEFIKKYGVVDCAASAIAFLTGKELLNDDKVREFLKED